MPAPSSAINIDSFESKSKNMLDIIGSKVKKRVLARQNAIEDFPELKVVAKNDNDSSSDKSESNSTTSSKVKSQKPKG